MDEYDESIVPLDVLFGLNETRVSGPAIFERDGLTLEEIDKFSREQIRLKKEIKKFL